MDGSWEEALATATMISPLPQHEHPSAEMAALEAVPWRAGLAIVQYGLRIGIRSDEPALVARALEQIPPGWQAAPSPLVERIYSLVADPRPLGVAGDEAILYVDGQRSSLDLSQDEVIEAFEAYVHPYLAEFARERIAIHAGVAGWRGCAIVLPGRTLAGKSTLVRGLLQAGASYYSDEYAMVDAEGLIYPFPRRLSLRRPDSPLPGRHHAREFGAETGGEPLTRALIAIARYVPRAHWRPHPISSGKAAMELLNNTVGIRHQPRLGMAAIERLTARAQAVQGARGELDAVVPWLLETAARV